MKNGSARFRINWLKKLVILDISLFQSRQFKFLLKVFSCSQKNEQTCKSPYDYLLRKSVFDEVMGEMVFFKNALHSKRIATYFPRLNSFEKKLANQTKCNDSYNGYFVE
jgi:hypothetical protein